MIAVQPATMFLVFWIKLGDKPPEVASVVSVHQVTDFVNDHIINHLMRSHN